MTLFLSMTRHSGIRVAEVGMALGAQLAARDRRVICTQGGGAYMYGNPVPAHYVARAESLPILSVVFDNEQWGAVRRNTRDM